MTANSAFKYPPPPAADNLVAVAMSGGVDSSVAACLLHEAGWNVVGVTMKLRRSAAEEAGDADRSCCTLDSAMDARRVCEQLGVPHYTLDLVDEFSRQVVEPFVQEYLQGRTPNPCVSCNSFLKWDALWDRVRAVGATHLATGHYARIQQESADVALLVRGDDVLKDQSYFLWGIPPATLARTVFPIAALTKPQVREIAARHGLRTAHKAESQDICFIPDGDKDRFLQEQIAASAAAVPPKPGDIRDQAGKVLGQHPGLAFFTVGQRKGLGIATGYPAFVSQLDSTTNTLVIGPRESVQSDHFSVHSCNWFVPQDQWEETLLHVQVRHRARTAPCKIAMGEHGLEVWLEEPVFGVTPGQSAVFYRGSVLVGGGLIGPLSSPDTK